MIKFLKKCREIWNKITELTGIDDPTDFVETNLDDDDEDQFIMLEVEKIQVLLEMILYLIFILF